VLWVLRPRGLVLFFWLGSVLPGVLLAWYHHACFGSVFATANAHEAKMFESQHLWLGFFGIPQPAILGKLLFSEYRGLFITSPVLILAALAAARMLWRKQIKPEIILCGAVFVMFLAINSAFQGEGWDPWSGGWSFGPRYLIPGVALLAVALVPAFNWLPRLTGALAVASAAIMLLGTAVDPQPPMGILKPLADYILPLASGTQVLIANNPVSGPVSANPMGVYESWYYRVFPPGSREARWNSFNLGELIFPDSLLSLVPLIAILAAGVWLAWRGALAEGLGKPARVVQGKIKSAG
jgi:NADH:ubiquinone oxidoreductase subunit 6 (subunit J)